MGYSGDSLVLLLLLGGDFGGLGGGLGGGAGLAVAELLPAEPGSARGSDAGDGGDGEGLAVRLACVLHELGGDFRGVFHEMDVLSSGENR